MYDIVRPLFVKETPSSPWDRLKTIISKERKTDALKATLFEWQNHNVLKNIAGNRKLFKNVDPKAIKAELNRILDVDDQASLDKLGQIQDYVDTGNRLGSKQKVEQKVKQRVQQKVKAKVKVKKRHVVQKKLKMLPTVKREIWIAPLRRDPFPPREFIPLHTNLFITAAHAPVQLTEAMALSSAQLVEDSLASFPKFGGGVAASELLALDPELGAFVGCADFSNIVVSWNVAQLWRSTTPSPLFTPYGIFAQAAVGFLVIQEKTTNSITVKLVERQEAALLAARLKDDRESFRRGSNSSAQLSTSSARLALYHFNYNVSDELSLTGKARPISGRVVAHGADSVHGDGSMQAVLRDQFHCTMAKAMLLAGVTRFRGRGEERALEDIIRYEGCEASDKAINRKCNGGEFARAYAHSIRNRNRTASNFGTSHLAQVLTSAGSLESALEEISNPERVRTTADMKRFLLDRSLSVVGRLKLANEGLRIGFTNIETRRWSSLLVPLLPILEGLEIRGTNGLHRRYNQRTSGSEHLAGLLESSGRLKPAAALRPWVMREFFSKLSDEYAAWKTAAPMLVLPKNTISSDVASQIRSEGGQVQMHKSHLTLAIKAGSGTYAASDLLPGSATQLEVMADLAHPM